MEMTILQAIILGIVQGATEFIPISSSAHLIIVPWLAGWDNPALTSLPFDVALHLGTLLAVLVFFAEDWWRLLRAGIASILERRIGNDPDRRLAWFVVLGTLPGAIVGALAESKIEVLFHQPNVPIQAEALIVMALIIAVWGLLLWLADRLARHLIGLSEMSFQQALLIGLSQALAIFPGVSRSGATIATGLALGLKRDAAAKFSFLLSAPVIAGAGIKSIFEVIKGAQTGAMTFNELILFPVGFIAAAIMGYLCIRFLIGYLQRHTVGLFVWYRLALAALIVLVVLIR
jgi:undecaprenyl-diphosphatase